MKKLTLSISLVFLLVIGVNAQKARTQYGEYGIGVSTLNMNSEISNTSSVSAIFKEVRPQITAFGKYHFNDWFGAGVEMSYGVLYASDNNHQNFERGFATTTNLFHSNAFMEAHFIRFGKYRYDRKFSLFVKAGAGIAAWNPEVSIASQIPEGLTIENDAYSAFSYFTGIGSKFRIGYKSVLTAEIRLHNSGGDTLDGITLTGKDAPPADNDTFWGLMLSYSVLIF